MSLFDALKKIYVRLNTGQLKDFEKKHPSRLQQDRYLAKMEDTDDYYKISFNKYKCVCFYHYNRLILLAYNLGSLFLLLPVLFFFNRRHINHVERTKSRIIVRQSKILGYKDIMPDQLANNYDVIGYTTNYSDIYLDKDSNRILWKAFTKHPLSFYYLLVLMTRLARQSTIANRENPEIICTYAGEREFSDPILTMYSEKRGIFYYGFMHGDFMYQIDHAFMKYSCYWVWDKHYTRMFTELRCKQKMIEYTPQKYKPLPIKVKSEEECEYYATYYFSGESKKSIDELVVVFNLLRDIGKKCKIRPHPRFSNLQYLQESFADYTIEDTKTISLAQSLENSYLIVALNSTVLSEAYHSGKIVVIDDISDKHNYQELKDKEYILYSKANYRLSEILKMNGVTP